VGQGYEEIVKLTDPWSGSSPAGPWVNDWPVSVMVKGKLHFTMMGPLWKVAWPVESRKVPLTNCWSQ
jgi:hypothetical protein